MRTVAATRQTTADLTTKPKVLDWLVYCRENKLLTASEWALAALLVTLGQGQNITLSITGMADILGMRRDTVSKAINGLLAKGLMAPKGNGQHNKTFYRLTMPKSLPKSGPVYCPNEDQCTDGMRTSHCPNEDHNIEDIDEDRDEETTSTSGDGVGRSSSGDNRAEDSTRAKGSSSAKDSARPSSTRSGSSSSASSSVPADKAPGQNDVPAPGVQVPGVSSVSPDDQGVPPIEDYIADLEECAGALAVRLGVDEDDGINIKVLAGKLRDLCVLYDYHMLMSDIINSYEVDDRVWWKCSRKAVPVGYFLNEIEREMIQSNKNYAAEDKELEDRFLELFTGRDYLPGHRISELMPDVDFEVSMALIKRLLDEPRIVKISSPPNSYKLAS